MTACLPGTMRATPGSAPTRWTVPGEFVKEVSGGVIDYPWPAQVNKLLVEGGFDLILSIGQVVPHEVAGMANYNKNIFVGTGGSEGINKSHFIGAAYGMENVPIKKWPYKLINILESDKVKKYRGKTQEEIDDYDTFINYWKKYIETRFENGKIIKAKSFSNLILRNRYFYKNFK